MKEFLFLVFCYASLPLFSQSPDFEWIDRIGGELGDYSYAMTIDDLGSVYITGTFRGTVDFDPSPIEYNLMTASDNRNLFVSKYDQGGQLIWAKSFGDEGNLSEEVGIGIIADISGNVYITGHFNGVVDFDPSGAVYNLSSEEYDTFILKLDTNGSFLWVTQIAGGSSEFSTGIALGSNDNIYVSGYFELELKYFTGSSYNTLNSDDESNDIFIAKIDGNGDFVWVKTIGGGESDTSYSLALDSFDNIYFTGSFGETVDFDPDTTQFYLTALEYRGLYVTKLSNDGTFVWAKSMGELGSELVASDLITDETGNIHITGFFDGSVDFDPDVGSSILASSSRDIFILKLSNSGTYLWAKAIGGSGLDAGLAIALDSANNVYTTGFFRGITDFDPDIDSFILASSSSTDSDVFILKLGNNGEFDWVTSFYGNGHDQGLSIFVDNWNNIYSTGTFQDTTDFGPSTEAQELISNGVTDIFLHKMSQGVCTASLDISSLNSNYIICEGDSLTLSAELSTSISGITYFWNTGDTTESILIMPDSTSNYSVSVSYLSDSTICNNLASVVVTVIDDPIIITTENQELCLGEEALLEASGGTSYFWSTGDTTSLITITAGTDQTYSVSVTDVNGCRGVDSIEVLINALSDTTYSVFTSCDSLMVGISEFIYFDQNGCDSIVIETTGLILLPQTPIAPTDLLIQENALPFQLIIPEVPNATSYSWQVPPGVQILSGANTSTITINWDDQIPSGSVCVSALNECGSSSADCMEITVDFTDGLEEIKNKGYSIFPNPADDFLNVFFEDEEAYEIILLDDLGRIVVYSSEYVGQAEINIRTLTSGTYWLKISSKREVYWERVEVVRR